jgi:hypothetical protein
MSISDRNEKLFVFPRSSVESKARPLYGTAFINSPLDLDDRVPDNKVTNSPTDYFSKAKAAALPSPFSARRGSKMGGTSVTAVPQLEDRCRPAEQSPDVRLMSKRRLLKCWGPDV